MASCAIDGCDHDPDLHIVVVDRDDPSQRIARDVCLSCVLERFFE